MNFQNTYVTVTCRPGLYITDDTRMMLADSLGWNDPSEIAMEKTIRHSMVGHGLGALNGGLRKIR